TFMQMRQKLKLDTQQFDRTFCHQVGVAHRRLLFEELGLAIEKDYATLERLGNTGSAALPVTMALGLESDPPTTSTTIAMLGIGSGINCVMLGAQWQQTRVAGGMEP